MVTLLCLATAAKALDVVPGHPRVYVNDALVSELGAAKDLTPALSLERSRVALGDCSPRAPTDPDVRDYRIRLLVLWVR